MPKGVKIKRYNRIYQGHRPLSSLLLRGVGTVVAVCVLGFIGWNAYGPVSEYLTELAARQQQKPASAAPSAPSEPEVVALPEPETAEPAAPERVKAAYAPPALLLDEAGLDAFLKSCAEGGVNAILFDLKDTAGSVLYSSSLEQVTQAKAQAQAAYNLTALCDRLAEYQMTPIGRLNAFRDPIASVRIDGAGVKYSGTEMLWLDNAKDAGGKPWLNPYSEAARGYVVDIAVEAVSLGVREILLDNASFPGGFGQEYATYGSTGGMARSDALSSFIDTIESKIKAAGGTLNVYIPATAALGVNDAYYGANPLTLVNEHVTIGVMPSLFGDGFSYGDAASPEAVFTLKAPMVNPGATVDTLLKRLAPALADKQVTGMIQAYTADGNYENNKPYTAGDLTAQVDALTANGVESFIAYSPRGNYPQ